MVNADPTLGVGAVRNEKGKTESGSRIFAITRVGGRRWSLADRRERRCGGSGATGSTPPTPLIEPRVELRGGARQHSRFNNCGEGKPEVPLKPPPTLPIRCRNVALSHADQISRRRFHSRRWVCFGGIAQRSRQPEMSEREHDVESRFAQRPYASSNPPHMLQTWNLFGWT
jgi:hypothetical protein